MGLKGKVEAIIYAAEEPVTLDQIAAALTDPSVDNVTESADLEHSCAQFKEQVRATLEELSSEYANNDRGMEVRQIAGGYRMATKPEHHDVVRAFARSLKPPVRLSLQALETLAVIAYKQPVTVPEINEIRGVDSGGVIGTLLDRKLITTAGRKAVIGRPILYHTSKEFLLRFGLKDLGELPSLEEFEKLAAESTALFEGPHTENGTPADAVASEPQPPASPVATLEAASDPSAIEPPEGTAANSIGGEPAS